MRILRLLFAVICIAACGERAVQKPPAVTASHRPALPDEPAERERVGGRLVLRYPPPVKPPLRNPAVRARLIHSPPPKYPEVALKARVQGIVILELVVERDGRVSGGRVRKPLPFGLDHAAMDAVRHWRYTPAEDPRGKPVRSVVSQTVHFRLPR